jgi:hypothetical protein
MPEGQPYELSEVTGEIHLCTGDIDPSFEGVPFQTDWSLPGITVVESQPQPEVEGYGI